MQGGVIAKIQALQRMSVGELHAEWMRLYGEPSRSRHRDYLIRRLCWRVQELAYGGLSDAAKARIAELAPAGFVRARVPNGFEPLAIDAAPIEKPLRASRDPRLPSPGTVITRRWRGRELRLLVLDDGYEVDGVRYESLTAAARGITGQAWSGWLFFGLRQRSRRP